MFPMSILQNLQTCAIDPRPSQIEPSCSRAKGTSANTVIALRRQLKMDLHVV